MEIQPETAEMFPEKTPYKNIYTTKTYIKTHTYIYILVYMYQPSECM